MYATTHIITGAVCGIMSGNPILAFVTGFVSHIILDLVPHHDQCDYLEEKKYSLYIQLIAVTDFLIGCFLLWFFLRSRTYPIVILAVSGAFGGTLLDLLDYVIFGFLFRCHRKTKIAQSVHRFHVLCHTYTPLNRWLIGLLTQIGSIVSSVLTLCFV